MTTRRLTFNAPIGADYAEMEEFAHADHRVQGGVIADVPGGYEVDTRVEHSAHLL